MRCDRAAAEAQHSVTLHGESATEAAAEMGSIPCPRPPINPIITRGNEDQNQCE
jgi:hypothetical protein